MDTNTFKRLTDYHVNLKNGSFVAVRAMGFDIVSQPTLIRFTVNNPLEEGNPVFDMASFAKMDVTSISIPSSNPQLRRTVWTR